jgi:hypothetical protein
VRRARSLSCSASAIKLWICNASAAYSAEAYRQPAAVMHALVVRADECEVGRAMQKRNLRRGYAVSPPSNGAHLPLVFGLRLPLLLQLMLPGPCNLNRRCSSRGCMLHELGLSPVWACTRFRRQV